jgi:hypothetical protein
VPPKPRVVYKTVAAAAAAAVRVSITRLEYYYIVVVVGSGHLYLFYTIRVGGVGSVIVACANETEIKMYDTNDNCSYSSRKRRTEYSQTDRIK